MVFRVEIAPRALIDIETAFLHIKKESLDRAARWLRGILNAVYSLEEMPERCARVPESADVGQEICCLLYGRRRDTYKIFFSIHSSHPSVGTVRVFHVRHSAQKWLRLKELGEMMESEK